MNNVRTELYQLTQEELLLKVKDELTEADISFKEDKYGNIWSFNHKDRPAFVAHCDTVIGGDEKYKIPVEIDKGIMIRPNTVLGADDRAGVNLILNHKESINFILTKDEEIGCLGAKFMSKNKEFIDDCNEITWFCELDRRNGKDILGNTHGYCSKDLVEALNIVLPNHKDVSGVFTDIDEFIDISQGVNLSVGYYNAHTIREYLDIEEFEYINSKILEISEIDGFKEKYDKPINKRSYYNIYDDIDSCEFCGLVSRKVRYFSGVKMCPDCLEDYYPVLYPEDNNPIRCDVCSNLITENEKKYVIKGWDAILCQHCVEVKYL